MIFMNCFLWYTVGLHRLQAAGAGQGMYLVQGPLGLLISSESCVCVNPQSLISQKIPSASFLPSLCQQPQLSCAGLRLVSSPIHSMAVVNLKKLLQHQSEHQTGLKSPSIERSIFQIFWKVHCCAKFLFLELATSDLHNKPGFDQNFNFELRMDHHSAQ